MVVCGGCITCSGSSGGWRCVDGGEAVGSGATSNLNYFCDVAYAALSKAQACHVIPLARASGQSDLDTLAKIERGRGSETNPWGNRDDDTSCCVVLANSDQLQYCASNG